MKTEKARHTLGRAAYAPHAANDRIKIARMIMALRSGGRDALPACWAQGDEYGHADCYEGSHRLYAWEIMGMEPRIAVLSQDDLDDAAANAGYIDSDDMHGADLEDITAALDKWDADGRPQKVEGSDA